MRVSARVLGGFGAFVLLAGGVATAIAGNVETPFSNGPRAPERPKVQEASGEQRELMEVFRRSAQPKERVPADIRELVAQEAGQNGENVDLARAARNVPNAQAPVWIWPADRAVCYFVEGGGSCPPTSVLARDGIAASASFRCVTGDDCSVRIDGLARDGIDTVVLDLAAGDKVSTNVEDNAFVLPQITSKPVAVTAISSDGRRIAVEPPLIPPDIFGS